MIDFEKIQGKKIIQFLNELKDNKVFIKMHLKGQDYERLTLLTDVRRKFTRSYFSIGCPKDFIDVISGRKEWRLDFEVTGRDGLSYSFTTSGGEIKEDEIIIKCPVYITRNQRRQNFRLEAPMGSTIEFKINGMEYSEKVIDVSLGGALVALVRIDKSQKDLPFKIGDILSDIELIFPIKKDEKKIFVKQANVVRFDKNASKTGTGCGLQFVDVDDGQLEILTQFIYTQQRYTLRNRIQTNS